MEKSTLSTSFGGRWGDMSVRLKPLLGEMSTHLGRRWHEILEGFFTEADLRVAVALRRKAKPDWYVIRYSSAGLALDDEGDGLLCAPSFQEAIASLLKACEGHRILPTAVEFDLMEKVLRLSTEASLLATVLPMRMIRIDSTSRKRAISTMTGVRTAANPADELLKRIRRWPGLSGVRHPHGVDIEPEMELSRRPHHPIPREWLVSARLLCEACGRLNADTAFIESVAAAALGSESWNHLAAPMGDKSSQLLQPWYARYGDDVIPEQSSDFYMDAIDAFADVLTKIPGEYLNEWSGVTLETYRSYVSVDYVPIYWFREQRSEKPPPVSPSRYEGPNQVALYPVLLSEKASSITLKRVTKALEDGGVNLPALFGVGLSMETKASMLDQLHGEVLIVQDGEWRFTRTDTAEGLGTLLRAYRFDSLGNCVERAGVPTYKGLLQTHRASGSHVLCADYDGRHPVALIQGLSPLSVAKIRAQLIEATERRIEFSEDNLSKSDREKFQELIQRLTAV